MTTDDKAQNTGASVSPTGLSQAEPQEGLGPSGFHQRGLAAVTWTEKCRRLLSSDKSTEFTISRVGLETLVADSERYGESNRVSNQQPPPTIRDTVMLGRFVAQYDQAADGFFVDADEAQQVAGQISAALTLHDGLIRLLRRCSAAMWAQPPGSAGWDFAREIDAVLASAIEAGTATDSVAGVAEGESAVAKRDAHD